MSKNVHTHLYAQNITKTHTCSSDVHWHSFKINWLILIQILERRSFEANQLPLNESSFGISTEMTWLFNQEYDSFHVVFTKWRWTVGHWRRLRKEREDMFLQHDHQQDLVMMCPIFVMIFVRCPPIVIIILASHQVPDHGTMGGDLILFLCWFSGTVLGAGVLAAIVNAIMKCGSLKGVEIETLRAPLSHFDGICMVYVCLHVTGRFFHKDVGNYAILGIKKLIVDFSSCFRSLAI